MTLELIKKSRQNRFFIAPLLLAAVILAGSSAGADLLALKETSHNVESRYGSYLAGRLASRDRDMRLAARFFEKSLDQDPGNILLLERTFAQNLVAGNWPEAKMHAERILQKKPDFSFAHLYLGVEKFKAKSYDKALAHFDQGGGGVVGVLVKDVANAWVLAERGKTDRALALLQKKSKSEWDRYFRLYQTALIADKAGKTKIAEKAYGRLFKKYRRMARLTGNYASFLARGGKRMQAEKILQRNFKNNYRSPDLLLLQNKILTGKDIAPFVVTPQAALAEIFYSLGDKQGDERSIDDAITFLQLTRRLAPHFDQVNYTLGEIFVSLKRFDVADGVLSSVPKTSPYWPDVMVVRAQSLRNEGKNKKAVSLLQNLTQQRPDYIDGLSSIGKLYMDQDKFGECTNFYSKAINLVKTPSEEHWHYYYGRGICYERMKVWPKAESDFKQALKLRKDQPDVLNYLGYSWVDQNINLDQAFDLIRKAVKLQPNSGYYVDSLGWAHYRMGNMKEAVVYLERAVELQPDDPVINDHLGDIYWHTGRELEASFQWKQVLSLKPEKDLEAKVKEKLIKGLAPLQKRKKSRLKKASNHK